MLSAAAKVNLVLEVLGRRHDGYHDIATVMQTVDLADRVVLEDAHDLELRADSAEVPIDGTNLAMRAAVALRDATGATAGVRITLQKRIPVAAGLGGGSTDAAAVLIGLKRLWGLRMSVRQLDEVAVRLGMDVPFFLRGGVALATGRGERLEPLRGRALALVMVNPRLGLRTAETYGRVTPAQYSDGDRARAMVAALEGGEPARVARCIYNGLEAAVTPHYPQIQRMKAAVLASGGLAAAMSGSGPTVFGVARSFEHARQLRARLARTSWSTWAVRTLDGPAVRVEVAARGRVAP